MNRDNRDLLVLFSNDRFTGSQLEIQINSLHALLFAAERLDNFVRSHEIIDMVHYKMIKKRIAVKNYIRKQKDTPFIFLNSLN